MFAVVQHEEQRASPQLVDQRLHAAWCRAGIQPEDLGYGIGHQQRLPNGREVDEPDSVHVLRTNCLRGLQCQSGLAAAASPGEGEQASMAHQPLDVNELTLAPDEACQRGWQITDGIVFAGHAGGLVEALLGRRAGQQLAKQFHRPGVRVGPERVEEFVDQPLISCQCFRPPAHPSQHHHLRAHGSLVDGIGFERMGEDDQRFLRRALRHRGRQFHQYLAMDFPELIAACRQPVRIRQLRQKITTVQVGRIAQACLDTCSQRCHGRTLELQDIDVDRASVIQHDHFTADGEQPVAAGSGASERTASDVQGLMQIPCGGHRLHVRPQAVQYLLATATLTTRQRQHRHHGLCLLQPPVAVLDGVPVDVHDERAEKLDAQPALGRLHGSSVSARQPALSNNEISRTRPA